MGLFSRGKLFMKLMNRMLVAEALKEMEDRLTKVRDPMEQHAIQYAYANALFTYTGMGSKAREAFRELFSMQNNLNGLPRDSELIMWTIHNNAQLSSNYEEYFKYVDIMRSRFPGAPLVTSQYPEVETKQKAGILWSEVQMTMALSYGQNKGLSRPTTMYSCMACLYSLILHDTVFENRSEKQCDFLNDISYLYTESVSALVNAYRSMAGAMFIQSTVDLICDAAVTELTTFDSRQRDIKEAAYCSTLIDRVRKGQVLPPRYDANEFNKQSGLMDAIIDKTEKALYLDVVNGYAKAETEVTEPIFRILLAHNHSIFYWSYIGQGSIALELMEKEWQLWESICIRAENIPEARLMAGQTAENAMLVSPDIESFVKWRDRLASVDPGAKILEEIGRTFVENYENGSAWWDCMSQIAMSMYDRNNPSLDSGRYGNAAATWQMILENRKKLRLPAEGWKVAAMEYGILALRLVAQNARRLGSSYNVSQGAMPVQVAKPFIEEYVAAHPGDEVETAILKDIKMVLSEAEG